MSSPWPRVVPPLASVPLLLVGCASQSRACTTIGADPGVRVDYSSVLRGHAGQDVTVRACVDRACDSRQMAVDDRQWSVALGQDTIGPSPVQVRLTITDTASGRTIFRGRTQVSPHRVQPNGEACPPTAWVGAAVATGTSTLTPAHGQG